MKSVAKLQLVTSKPPPRSSLKPQPPKRLSKESRAWFEEMRDSFNIIDPAGLRTLIVACDAIDEMARTQAVLRKAGDYYKDRNGIQRQHPASHHYDVARRAYLTAIRLLKLRTR
jgi:hypothetical protein